MTEQFDAAHDLAAHLGLDVSAFVSDGKWHRVPVKGRGKNNTDGAYILSEMRLKSDRVVVLGLMCNHLTGEEQKLTISDAIDVSADDLQEAREQAKRNAEQAKRDKIRKNEEVAQKALRIWNGLPDQSPSPYLDAKKVKAWGIRFGKGRSTVIPARDAGGKLWTLQFIQAGGDKRFLSGGAKRGHFHLIGHIAQEGDVNLIGIAEGYATAASIYEAYKSFPVAVAFDSGNLLAVGAALRGVYPASKLRFFADHDVHKGYPKAFIKKSQLNPSVDAQIARIRRVRPDVIVDVVEDHDPRLKDRTKSYNVGVAKAILAAASVGNADVIIPVFEGCGNE